MPVTTKASRSTYVETNPTNRMTLSTLRRFVQECDEVGIPDDLQLEVRKSQEGHWTGASVRWTQDLEPETDPEPRYRVSNKPKTF